jgi:polyhydroxybutyrate depolymerase
MRAFLRFLRWSLIVVVSLAAVLGGLFGYFVYSPEPAIPQLSGTLTMGTIEVGGFKRLYRLYVPRSLPKGSPLVVAMHGSGQSGAQLRIETGYGFERLADQRGFAVVYPNALEGYWDACNIIGALGMNSIDDVGFLTLLVDKVISEIGVDPNRVFATGISRGGAMALRLALETPSRFRAVAVVSSNVPTSQNFKCKPSANGTSSVMIMNGTEDPLVPFNGGEVSLFGLFYKNGPVLSARASAQYLADLNHIAAAPQTNENQLTDGIRVARAVWRNDTNVEVELVAIHGGGHSLPQPYRRAPRLLGPSPTQPNGSEVIWDFFARQQPR